MVDSVDSTTIGSNIITALGAGSGIDTGSLTSQLVELEGSVKQNTIDTKRETIEAQISDYGLVRSALSTLQESADLLGNSETFNTKTATLGENSSIVPTELAEEAPVGNYAFTVESIALSQSLSTSSSYEDPSSAVGKGTLTFNFGEWSEDLSTFTGDTSKESVTITIDDSNNSLTGLANAINEADMGVKASVINDGVDGYRLLISAETGAKNQLSITAAENASAPGLASFNFDETTQAITQQQAGTDAQLTFNGLPISRSSNDIDDVLEGFKFSLAKATPGEVITVSITEDTSVAQEAVRGFVDAFNAFLEAIEPAIGYNEEIEDNGSLYRDATTKTILNQMRNLISSAVPGIEEGFNALANVGIQTELDGTISLNEEIFSEAFASNYELIKDIFTPQASSSSDFITVNGWGDKTTPGSYEVEITADPEHGYLTGTAPSGSLLSDLASASTSPGYYTGSSAASSLLDDLLPSSGNLTGEEVTAPLNLLTNGAASGDYDFAITIDGVDSAAPISLPVIDYLNYDDMASALQLAINSDANFSGVSVAYDTDHFVITGTGSGVESTVSVTDIGAAAETLGLSTGTSVPGTGGANDFDFSLTVDGVGSGVISLPPGSYADQDSVAAALQTQINSDSNLSGAGVSVNVTWNNDHFEIQSQSSGEGSTVSGLAPIGGLASRLGLSDGEATAGSLDTQEYDFTISVDGSTSETISLTPAAYGSNEELAAHIQDKINADPTLAGDNKSVDVSWDGSQFVVTSNGWGTQSTVSVTAVGSRAADLGLDTGTSTAGKDVEGTIDGEPAFGSGQVLLPDLDAESYGLKFLIEPGATNATIGFSRGFGDELSKLIDAYLESGGIIAGREDNLESDLDDLDDDQDRLDTRMTAYQERLQAQFLAMETIIASIDSDASFLEDLADRLPNTASS